MKKIKNVFISFALILGFIFTLASCGKDNRIKVTFYDGENVLKVEKVAKGKTATEWTPTKEGYAFEGWFGTPNFNHVYNFENEITEPTSIFASFKSMEYVADTREWIILGNGNSPILKACAWNNVSDEQKLTKVNAEGINKFQITIQLEKDDEFQFAINNKWENQRGGGYMADPGNCFKVAAGALSSNTKKANIKVLKSGTYTFTLVTYPGQDYYDTKDPYYTNGTKEKFNYNDFDTITWEKA